MPPQANCVSRDCPALSHRGSRTFLAYDLKTPSVPGVEINSVDLALPVLAKEVDRVPNGSAVVVALAQ